MWRTSNHKCTALEVVFELPLTCSMHAPPVLDTCSPGKHDPITVCVGVHSCLSALTPAHSPESSDVSLIGTLYLCSPPSPDPVHFLCRKTEGYSCSDLTSLARDAAFGPIRGSTSHYWFCIPTPYSLLPTCTGSVCVWWTRRVCVSVCCTACIPQKCFVNACRTEHVTSQRLPRGRGTVWASAVVSPGHDIAVLSLTPASLQVRPILCKDFVSALEQVKSSVSRDLLADMERWKQEYGANS